MWLPSIDSYPPHYGSHGIPQLTRLSLPLNSTSVPPLSSPCLTQRDSSSWSSMHRTLGWGRFCISALPRMESYTPVPFFSRRLSHAESNYSIGDRELLAIKMALEEWRHWLEGSKQPFLVWTDHKNSSMPRSWNQVPSLVHRTVCFSQHYFALRCFSGATPPSSPAIWEWHGPATQYRDGFGGQL